MLEHAQEGIVVMILRGPSGQDVGAALEDLVRILAVDQIEELAVPVEVVEVLQQPEVEGGLDVGVGLGAGQVRRQLDGHLLEADRRLQHALVRGIEPVDGVLLLVLDAPDGGQPALQGGVVADARKAVREHARLVLDAVHEDHAAARERVDLLFAVGGHGHLRVRSELLLDRYASFTKRIHSHRCLTPPLLGPWPAGACS
jgi:hypothetical protein